MQGARAGVRVLGFAPLSMGLKSGLKALLLWRRLNKFRSAVEREGKMYDVKKSLLKGLKGLALGVAGVAGLAAADYLSNAAAVTGALTDAGLSQVLVLAAVPLVTGAAEFLRNWIKHGLK